MRRAEPATVESLRRGLERAENPNGRLRGTLRRVTRTVTVRAGEPPSSSAGEPAAWMARTYSGSRRQCPWFQRTNRFCSRIITISASQLDGSTQSSAFVAVMRSRHLTGGAAQSACAAQAPGGVHSSLVCRAAITCSIPPACRSGSNGRATVPSAGGPCDRTEDRRTPQLRAVALEYYVQTVLCVAWWLFGGLPWWCVLEVCAVGVALCVCRSGCVLWYCIKVAERRRN